MNSRVIGGLAAAIASLVLLVSCSPVRRLESASARAGAPVAAPGAVGARFPKSVLLVGDSVMWDLGPGLRAALHAGGATEIWGEGILGMGLTRGDYYDWRTAWPAAVADHHPEAVVVELGAWDIATQRLAGQLVDPGTTRWNDWFRPMLDEAMSDLTAGGAQVWWLSVLPVAMPGSAPRTRGVNTEMAEAAARHPGVHFVDLSAPMSGPSGQFAARLRDERVGRLVKVRKDDGVHLCAPGVVKVSAALLEAMSGPASVKEPWASGQWQTDPRYHHREEGCDSYLDGLPEIRVPQGPPGRTWW